MRILSIIFAAALLVGLASAPSIAKAAPGGSYRNSCRNLHVYGPMLSADCQAGWGWRTSQINYKRCYGDIANQNGYLVCRGNRGPYPYGRGGYDNDGRYEDDYGYNSDDRYDRDYGYGGGRYGALVLFGDYGFTGPAFATSGDISNLDRTRFNDRAQSVRITTGVWLLCENANFGGRCITLSHSEPDLARYGMNGAISSVRRLR